MFESVGFRVKQVNLHANKYQGNGNLIIVNGDSSYLGFELSWARVNGGYILGVSKKVYEVN